MNPAIFQSDKAHHFCSARCLIKSENASDNVSFDTPVDILGVDTCEVCGSELMHDIQRFTYFNQCDRWRTRYDNGERLWQEMMKNKRPISLDVFLLLADPSDLLDEGERVEEFVADDPEHGFYVAQIGDKPVIFIAHAGFEFIFTEDGEAP